jgi:hypothetical protein
MVAVVVMLEMVAVMEEPEGHTCISVTAVQVAEEPVVILAMEDTVKTDHLLGQAANPVLEAAALEVM